MSDLREFTSVICLLMVSFFVQAQTENILLDRSYWKSQPSIEDIRSKIKEGNDPAAFNEYQFDPVTYAILESLPNETIQYLISLEGNDVNKITHDERNYIFWAAYRNNLSLMEYLVSEGSRTDLLDEHRNTVLNFAAATGQQNPAIYRYCLELKIDANLPDSHGNTPFLNAAYKCNGEILSLLMEETGDIETRNENGETALVRAIAGYDPEREEDFEEKLEILQKVGFDPEVSQENGNTFYHLAAERGELSLLQRAEKWNIDINAINNEGMTALHVAALKVKDENVLKYLVSIGADKSIQTDFDETAYDLAVENELLKEKGADLKFLKQG